MLRFRFSMANSVAVKVPSVATSITEICAWSHLRPSSAKSNKNALFRRFAMTATAVYSLLKTSELVLKYYLLNSTWLFRTS